MEREKIDTETVVLILSVTEHTQLRAILDHYERQLGQVLPSWGAKARRLREKIEGGKQ